MQNVVEKLVPDPFLNKSKLNIFLDQQSEFLYDLFFIVYPSQGHQNILKLKC